MVCESGCTVTQLKLKHPYVSYKNFSLFQDSTCQTSEGVEAMLCQTAYRRDYVRMSIYYQKLNYELFTERPDYGVSV